VNLSTGILNSEAASETVFKILWGLEHTTVNGICASLTFSDGRRRSGAKRACVIWSGMANKNDTSIIPLKLVDQERSAFRSPTLVANGILNFNLV